jgi:hypothetical protein
MQIAELPNLQFAIFILQFAMALSNYSFKPSVKRAGMELPTFLKERFDGCQGQTELQDHKLERI